MIRGVRVLTTLIAFAGFHAAEAKDAEYKELPTPANPSEALYRCNTVVTGTRVETRLPGFAECLRIALVKLSGDSSIVRDQRFTAATKRSRDYVQRFSYRDRLAGRPLHDEQGTHDRPQDLTVEFDPAKLDALARSLGRAPWPLPRPRVMMFLAVTNLREAFVLTSDGSVDRSSDMREALSSAAEKAGLPAIVLPTQSAVAAWTAKTLPYLSPRAAKTLARAAGGEAAIVGDAVLGWIVRWRMEHARRTYTWGTRGVNFDAAFRNALFGAAHVLSGRGAPK